MRRPRRLRVVIAIRAIRGRLPRFVTGSFTVHGLLLAAMVVIPATRHRTQPIEDSMVVALAGPIAAAPAHPGPPAPPAPPAPSAPKLKAAPEPAPQPKEAHAVREVPVVKPKDKVEKPKTPPAKEPDVAAPPKAQEGGPHGSSPTPAPTTAPAAGTGAVTATVGSGDSSLNWYGASVKAALEAAWAKPYLEDAAGTASVVVSFDIARDGTTRNLRVVQSSGIPTLDRSAQRAVIEASPLPGIPPAWTEDTIPVTMRFDLTPDNR